MRLQGLHHITMITADAPANVAFYADLLGLRLVKKTVNFDDPGAYHLYFGDERGTPGSILTWFEYRGARRGTPGAGMVHTIELGVADAAALDFWAERLERRGHPARRLEDRIALTDPDGLALELVVAAPADPPLRAVHPEVPEGHAIAGVAGARAYTAYATVREGVYTDLLGFAHVGGGEYHLQGDRRGFRWRLERAPGPGHQGAGSVHHIAWASHDEDHAAWRERLADAGAYVTDIIDRDYFHSIYFREPRGILFEIATEGPGFAVDEDPEHLGEELRVPAMHAHLAGRLQRVLTPLTNPRAAPTTNK